MRFWLSSWLNMLLLPVGSVEALTIGHTFIISSTIYVKNGPEVASVVRLVFLRHEFISSFPKTLLLLWIRVRR